jgi:hypothetical protein
MIVVIFAVVVVVLLAVTPWRRLPLTGRLWALASVLNALVFFSMPTTPATSSWRPIVARVLATSAGASLVLVAVGLVLRRRYGAAGEFRVVWMGPLILGALPSALYTFFWVIGPLY